MFPSPAARRGRLSAFRGDGGGGHANCGEHFVGSREHRDVAALDLHDCGTHAFRVGGCSSGLTVRSSVARMYVEGFTFHAFLFRLSLATQDDCFLRQDLSMSQRAGATERQVVRAMLQAPRKPGAGRLRPARAGDIPTSIFAFGDVG
jgi:hypothetical protein